MADVAPMTPKKALYAGHLSVTVDIVLIGEIYLIKSTKNLIFISINNHKIKNINAIIKKI